MSKNVNNDVSKDSNINCRLWIPGGGFLDTKVQDLWFYNQKFSEFGDSGSLNCNYSPESEGLTDTFAHMRRRCRNIWCSLFAFQVLRFHQVYNSVKWSGVRWVCSVFINWGCSQLWQLIFQFLINSIVFADVCCQTDCRIRTDIRLLECGKVFLSTVSVELCFLFV